MDDPDSAEFLIASNWIWRDADHGTGPFEICIIPWGGGDMTLSETQIMFFIMVVLAVASTILTFQ